MYKVVKIYEETDKMVTLVDNIETFEEAREIAFQHRMNCEYNERVYTVKKNMRSYV
jgi:nitrogen-specific signal transduction histidine kinase